eukprot:RCo027441
MASCGCPSLEKPPEDHKSSFPEGFSSATTINDVVQATHSALPQRRPSGEGGEGGTVADKGSTGFVPLRRGALATLSEQFVMFNEHVFRPHRRVYECTAPAGASSPPQYIPKGLRRLLGPAFADAAWDRPSSSVMAV